MMKPGTIRWTIAAVVIAFAMFIVWTVFSAPKHPVALIRVVDAAGKPVAGAIITPEGLRTKSGPYQSGWYGWPTAGNSVSNPPVKTDANGFARVGYPKYVFERIETGVLCLSVSDTNFVPDRPERAVATAPPAGAPWRLWADYLKDRIMHKELLSRVDPVVLQQGAALKVAMAPDSAAHWRTPLFVQISGTRNDDTNFLAASGTGCDHDAAPCRRQTCGAGGSLPTSQRAPPGSVIPGQPPGGGRADE